MTKSMFKKIIALSLALIMLFAIPFGSSNSASFTRVVVSATDEVVDDTEIEDEVVYCECEDCSDLFHDGYCDFCEGLMPEDYDYTNGGECYISWCTCSCNYQTWIGQLFVPLLLFFWELFGINQVCMCGRYHY